MNEIFLMTDFKCPQLSHIFLIMSNLFTFDIFLFSAHGHKEIYYAFFNNFIKEFIALHEALKVSFSGCATRLIMELFMQLANLKNLGWESC